MYMINITAFNIRYRECNSDNIKSRNFLLKTL